MHTGNLPQEEGQGVCAALSRASSATSPAIVNEITARQGAVGKRALRPMRIHDLPVLQHQAAARMDAVLRIQRPSMTELLFPHSAANANRWKVTAERRADRVRWFECQPNGSTAKWQRRRFAVLLRILVSQDGIEPARRSRGCDGDGEKKPPLQCSGGPTCD
jgi:hypothetical protein